MALTPEQEALSAQLTNLQRLTVLGVVEGKSQRQAYYDAGGKAKNDAAADTSAYEIMSRPEVRAFHDSFFAEAAQEAKITLQSILQELEDARLAAYQQERPQAAAMVAASMGKAKLLGYLTDKVDHTSSDGSMSPPKTVILCAPEVKE